MSVKLKSVEDRILAFQSDGFYLLQPRWVLHREQAANSKLNLFQNYFASESTAAIATAAAAKTTTVTTAATTTAAAVINMKVMKLTAMSRARAEATSTTTATARTATTN